MFEIIEDIEFFDNCVDFYIIIRYMVNYDIVLKWVIVLIVVSLFLFYLYDLRLWFVVYDFWFFNKGVIWE